MFKNRLERRGKIEKASCIQDLSIVYRCGFAFDLSGVFLDGLPAGVAAEAAGIIFTYIKQLSYLTAIFSGFFVPVLYYRYPINFKYNMNRNKYIRFFKISP